MARTAGSPNQVRGAVRYESVDAHTERVSFKDLGVDAPVLGRYLRSQPWVAKVVVHDGGSFSATAKPDVKNVKERLARAMRPVRLPEGHPDAVNLQAEKVVAKRPAKKSPAKKATPARKGQAAKAAGSAVVARTVQVPSTAKAPSAQSKPEVSAADAPSDARREQAVQVGIHGGHVSRRREQLTEAGHMGGRPDTDVPDAASPTPTPADPEEVPTQQPEWRMPYRKFRYDKDGSSVTFYFSQPLNAEEQTEARALIAHGGLELLAGYVTPMSLQLVAVQFSESASALDLVTRTTLAMIKQNWHDWEDCRMAAWFVSPSE